MMNASQLSQLKLNRARSLTKLTRKKLPDGKTTGVQSIGRAITAGQSEQETKKMCWRLFSYVIPKGKRTSRKMAPYDILIKVAKLFGVDPVTLYYELTPKEQAKVGGTPPTGAVPTAATVPKVKRSRPRKKKSGTGVEVQILIPSLGYTGIATGKLVLNGLSAVVEIPEMKIPAKVVLG